MNEVLQVVGNALVLVMKTVVGSLIHNWFPLLLATVISSIMRTYIDAERLKTTLLNKPKVSILASVAFGAFTPLCACGTMAVIIGMLTTTLPWGPVMAFLTSSPLVSPDGFVMIAGVLNLRIAIELTVASVLIGLGSGFVTHLIEKRTTYLKNQTRFAG
ncbi:MAG: permease, partial [Clostridia bacterium]|nr:permease [Clostridia bacterium]